MTNDVNIEVFVTEEDTEVYVKFSGFSNYTNAKCYAQHLAEYLPLMLFESEILH